MPDKVRYDYLQRFKDASAKGTFTMDDELNILTYLIDRYKFITVAEYARRENISHTAADKRIDAGGVMYMVIGGIKFVIP